MCSRASSEPLPHLHPDSSFGSGSFCLASFCSILCNCVLTPRESSQELAKLESITRAYQVRPRRSLLRLNQHASPQPPWGGSWEGKSYSEFERQHHHPGHFLAEVSQALQAGSQKNLSDKVLMAELSCWLSPNPWPDKGTSPGCPMELPFPPLPPTCPTAPPPPHLSNRQATSQWGCCRSQA